MANWIRSLDLKAEWEKSDEIGIPALALAVSEKLRAIAPYPSSELDERREEIADWFADLSQDNSAGVEDFDTLMAELYDFGDTPLDDRFDGKKALWVATF